MAAIWHQKAAIINDEEEIEMLKATFNMLVKVKQAKDHPEVSSHLWEQCLQNMIDSCSINSLMSSLETIVSTSVSDFL